MRLQSAIVLGKSISFLSRSLKKGGGSAAPGLYALKVDPQLVEKLAKKIPLNIVITGTNGKTTTARMIAHLATQSGLKVIRNHTGSNLERGIASALISHLSLPTSHFQLGVWELDEFAFNSVTPKLKPDVILFLNASRDQLDRYGEVDAVVNRWCKTISKLDPKTTILIDPSLSKLAKYFPVKKLPQPKNIKTNGLTGSSFQLTIHYSLFTIHLPIPGLYNIQNAVAALTAASYLNIAVTSLDSFQPAFGRFEKLPFGYIFLIKNPAGSTEVFKTIAPQIKPDDRLLIALNDNFADGTDVSWIWDSEFETLLPSLRGAKRRGNLIYCSGTRADDLAVRLKYAGFDPTSIIIQPSLENALQQAREGLKGQLFILPTYTALLELQRLLAKQGVKPAYWKEN